MEDREETNSLTIIGMAVVVVGMAVDSAFDADLLEPANLAGLLIMVFGVLILAYVVIQQGRVEDDGIEGSE
jgi:uncharacterized protein YjeT (DUF2065 family)